MTIFQKINTHKGQIVIALIGALGAIFASVFGARAVALSSIEDKTIEIDKRVAVVEERENLHYDEVQKQLEKIDQKLDKFLIKIK